MYLKKINGDIIDEGNCLRELVIKNKANLCEANLCEADLRGADLSVAYLSGANLCRADLRVADLRGADLRGADLSVADLRGADLSVAYLSGADLSRANLSGANLSGANLCEADLRGANLYEANRNGYKLNGTPVQILGLYWSVIIFDEHMEIGCEKHSFKDWKRFKDSRIEKMDTNALEFWEENKEWLLNICNKRV